MAPTQRFEDYRRRRHRAAARRRGYPTRPFAPPSSILRDTSAGPGVRPPAYLRGLGHLVRKTSAYPGLLAVFARPLTGCIDVLIVAPRPMTRAVRALAAAWGRELRLRCPWSAWSLTVSAVSPPPQLGYRCLYWRPSD